MTARQRLLAAIKNEVPDHVPAAPDLWEMVPIRLMNGRPSWEMLLYNDPPVWKARADAARHFGVDGFFGLFIPDENDPQEVIVYQDDQRIVTRTRVETEMGIEWSPRATLYTPNEASAAGVNLCDVGQPETPDSWSPVRKNYSKTGRDFFEDARSYVGEDGLIGPAVWLPCLPADQDEIYRYYDDPETVREEKRLQGERILKMTETYLSWNPDMLFIGNSGLMLFNPEPVFRELSLEWLKKITAMAKEAGVPTHIHCCGPEKTLVKIAAEETDLSSIEPLEIPPMGDCSLKELKQLYGDRIALKGNLHTTDLMLRGSAQQVADACRQAIDDAAEGGGFILSTGDQTPLDTPDENIRVMQEVAETHGKY
jgi:uroporphyrinogen decarboxylase